MENKENKEYWNKIGLIAGIECHQQLDTGKLFSRTPSKLREDKTDKKITRRLRASASELGEFDKAAMEAMQRKEKFEYEYYEDTISLIELDEEPPQKADKDAIKTIIEVALTTKSEILDKAYVMRKTVIDGSNTSGFQRTAIISIGGNIQINEKKIGIDTIAIEEDASKIIEKKEGKIIYRLDRLGIPLIELTTSPDIRTPEEAKETAKKIGEIFRRTCKVKRGLGSIRQDLNVSIKEGTRIELKGIQELDLMEEAVRREVQRQQKLLEIKKELKNRKIKEIEISEIKNIEKIFEKTECKFIKNRGTKKVMAFTIKNFKGIFGTEIQPNRRFGTEVANYVKSGTGVKGILHQDELPNYGITTEEIKKIGNTLNIEKNDLFIIVIENEKTIEKIKKIIKQRCEMALEGVPEETRNVIENGNSEYMRPLAGAHRMYPETDIAPIRIEPKKIEKIKEKLPLTIKEREEKYKTNGLNEKLIEEMKLNIYARIFDKVSNPNNSTKIAGYLLQDLTELRREGIDLEGKEKIIKTIIKESEKNELERKEMKKITKIILEEIENEEQIEIKEKIKELIKKENENKIKTDDIEKIIEKIIEKNQELIQTKKYGAIGALMGDIMTETKGKINGKEVSGILKEKIKKINSSS